MKVLLGSFRRGEGGVASLEKGVLLVAVVRGTV